MAKSKKSQSAAIQFGPVLKVFFLCFIIAGSAVGYVWQKSQIYELGREIKQRETRLEQLQAEDQKLANQLAILRSPVMLDQRAKALNLGLIPTQPGQVYRLPEPVLRSLQDNLARQLARDNDAPLVQ
jgi:cell division protein FtsL